MEPNPAAGGSAGTLGYFAGAGGDFLEAGFVVGVIRAHEAIPDIEVETVVPPHLFVVHDVVGGGVQDPFEGSVHEAAGVEFIAGVSEDIEDDLPHHEEDKSDGVDGNQQGGERKNAGLDECFKR